MDGSVDGPASAERSRGAISYLPGGGGQDRAAAIREAVAKHPLGLEFVNRSGPTNHCLAGVDVTINDRQGRIRAHTMTDGPYLLARLPDRTFAISAELDGQTRGDEVTVADVRQETVVFEW